MSTKCRVISLKGKFSILYPLVFVFFGCTSEPKLERDAHGSIIHEDPFKEDKLYKQKAEDFRSGNSYGVTILSEKCNEFKSGENGLTFPLNCQYAYLIRFRVQCEVKQAVGVPFHSPMRFKELQVNLVNIDKAILTDQKRFPSVMTTNQSGELDFSFSATDSLENFQIELSNTKTKVVVNNVQLSDPVLVPESFCSKN